jgi:DNA-binding NarL/FixJ family response regulator
LVLATISDQPDIEVMGEITSDDEIVRVAAESKPDFVIISLGKADERPLICDALLALRPELKILALAPERNRSMFFWSVMDIRSVPIESSEEGILNTLRSKGIEMQRTN